MCRLNCQSLVSEFTPCTWPTRHTLAYVCHVLVHRRVVLIRLGAVHVEVQQGSFGAATRILPGLAWPAKLPAVAARCT